MYLVLEVHQGPSGLTSKRESVPEMGAWDVISPIAHRELTKYQAISEPSLFAEDLRVSNRSDQTIRNEGPQWASTPKRFTGPKEQSSTNSASNLLCVQT